MDDVELGKFTAWLRLRGRADGRGMAPDTVEETLKVLDRTRRLGLDVDRYLEGGVIAQDEGDAFMLARLDEVEAKPEGKGDHGYNHYVRLLRTLSRYSVQEFGRAPIPSPWSYREWEETENTALSDEELKAVFAWTHRRFEPRLRGRALIHWAFAFGWRRGENAALEEPHLRPQPQCPWQPARDPHLQLPPGDEPYAYCAYPRKRGRRRWVPTQLETYSAHRPLVPWLRFRPICELHPLRIWTNSEKAGPCICMAGADLATLMRRIGKEAGLVELNFRRSRHTRGTRWFEDGVDLLVIQKRLGHRKAESTLVYTHVRRGYDLAAVSKERSLFSGGKEEHEDEGARAI